MGKGNNLMSKIKLSLGSMIFLTLLLAFLPHTANSERVILNVPQVRQKVSKWCWAASEQSILANYQVNQDQCLIANWSLQRNDCCRPYDYDVNHPCNEGEPLIGTTGSIQMGFEHWGVKATYQQGVLTKSALVTEIKAGRPFVVELNGYNRGEKTQYGHAVVVKGYHDNGSYLVVMDPTPGIGFILCTYEDVVRFENSNGDSSSWAATLKTTTDPKAACETGSASDISINSAKLAGTVDANGSVTTVYFEYGATTSYGSTVTADQNPITGTTPVVVSKTITGLNPSTTYHYRLKTSSSAGVLYGQDATFTTSALPTYKYTVIKTGNGSGTVTSTAGAITWNGSTGIGYTTGTYNILTAVPDRSNTFGRWTGGRKCGGCSDYSRSRLIEPGQTATAEFIPLETLSITIPTTESGSISLSSPGSAYVPCTSTSSYPILQYTTVSLTAAPNPGYVFSGWSGACTGTNICNVYMDQARSVTANFVLK